ncbi:hypothetical protein QUC31_008821 [Theobroma cacao]
MTNLSEDTREPDLLELFYIFGPVTRVYVAMDNKTGTSRGFGFVNFVNTEDAQRAIDKLNGYGYDNLISKGSKSHGKGVIKVHPQRVLPLHTTHSTDFLGLHQNMGFWKQSNFRKGVIIGVQDTGITPSHPSFSDEGVPPPEKWKGRCELVECNNKLIGARNFRNDEQGQAPLDQDGHSTHTASTTAGNFVQGASVFGKVNVTAVGMAP